MHTYCAVQGIPVVGSDMGRSASIPIQELTLGYRQAEGGTDSAVCLMRGDSHQLYLQDGSSKDYA